MVISEPHFPPVPQPIAHDSLGEKFAGLCYMQDPQEGESYDHNTRNPDPARITTNMMLRNVQVQVITVIAADALI